MKIYTIKEILTELDDCIKLGKPFSLIRFGDGGPKLIYSYLNQDQQTLKLISKKEGIPLEKMNFLIDSWRKYANEANFIDTVEVYFTPKFWPKLAKEKRFPPKETVKKLKSWKQLYQRIGMNNVRFVNPEINYLSALRLGTNKNIIDLMRNKKICFISKYDQKTLKIAFPFCELVSCIQIVSQHQDHYNKCFNNTIKEIKKKVGDFDLFMVAAGELGRIYSGVIKAYGGRTFDIGFMLDYWIGQQSIHPRLTRFVRPSPDNRYELVLTAEGRKYKEYL